MALFNVIKAQAIHLVRDPEKVKELTGKVKEKAEDFQARRRAEALLEDLGRFLYAEHTERTHPDAEVEIARLVAKLRTLEDDGVVILPLEEPPPAVKEPPPA